MLRNRLSGFGKRGPLRCRFPARMCLRLRLRSGAARSRVSTAIHKGRRNPLREPCYLSLRARHEHHGGLCGTRSQACARVLRTIKEWNRVQPGSTCRRLRRDIGSIPPLAAMSAPLSPTLSQSPRVPGSKRRQTATPCGNPSGGNCSMALLGVGIISTSIWRVANSQWPSFNTNSS